MFQPLAPRGKTGMRPLEQCVRKCRQTKPTVELVKKHLDALNDGIQMLNLYDAELTPDAIQSVRAAADVRDYHGRSWPGSNLKQDR